MIDQSFKINAQYNKSYRHKVKDCSMNHDSKHFIQDLMDITADRNYKWCCIPGEIIPTTYVRDRWIRNIKRESVIHKGIYVCKLSNVEFGNEIKALVISYLHHITDKEINDETFQTFGFAFGVGKYHDRWGVEHDEMVYMQK